MVAFIALMPVVFFMLLTLVCADGDVPSGLMQMQNIMLKQEAGHLKGRGAPKDTKADQIDSMLQFMKEFGASNGGKTFKENVPEVQAAFDEMIALVTDDIEPAIKLSFNNAQGSIDAALNDLDSSTTLAVDKKALAVSADSAFDTCRGQEKAALVLHETCIGQQNDLEDDKDTKCQAMDDAQVNNWQVTGSLATPKSCDFQADPSGCSDFEALETFVNNLAGSITVARNDYIAKTSACTAATDLYDNKVIECSGLNDDFNDKKSECGDLDSDAQVAMCTFGIRFQEKCEKLDDLNGLVTNITDGGASTQSEASRIDEWTSVQTVKCILESYVEGDGTFNEVTQTACTDDIDYAGDVGAMDYKGSEINGLTTAAKLSCTETVVTFSDAIWTTGGTSADYNQTSPYAVEVTLRPLEAKFATFC